MNSPESCPHFQTRVEKLPLELTVAYLPIRRCLLSERLIRLIRNHPEAAGVVKAFAVDSEAGVSCCICGPDLDSIDHSKCRRERCGSSCIPSYNEILAGVGIEDSEPVDCDEPARADLSI
jgi:hypothetical protein